MGFFLNMKKHVWYIIGICGKATWQWYGLALGIKFNKKGYEKQHANPLGVDISNA